MILLIGASGFIGSHLDDHFTSAGEKVFRCDARVIDGKTNFFLVDKFNPDYIPVLKATMPDICIYAGGNGNVPLSMQDPAMDFTLNTTDVWKLLHAIKEVKPTCKFMHISSAAVYGNPKQLPVKESDSIQPLSPYGWHKYMTENICREFHVLYGIPTISLRVFSVYGERLKKQLFWDLYQKFKKNTSVELFGTGNETRDFIYIADLIKAFQCLIDQAPFTGQCINVSSGIETTIKEAAHLFGNYYDPTVKISFNHQNKPGDPLNWKADISALLSFGFKATTGIDSGLKNYVQWLKENE